MLKDLYEDVKFSDITLISDDQTQFKAHKIVVDMNNIVKIWPQCEGVVGVRYSTLLWLWVQRTGLASRAEEREGEPAMNFVTPSQYSQSNLAHFHINCRAVNDFVKIYPALGREDR